MRRLTPALAGLALALAALTTAAAGPAHAAATATVTVLSISPQSPELSQTTLVTVTAHIVSSDPLTAVYLVDGCLGGDGACPGNMTMTSGTATDGVWVGTTPVDPCYFRAYGSSQVWIVPDSATTAPIVDAPVDVTPTLTLQADTTPPESHPVPRNYEGLWVDAAPGPPNVHHPGDTTHLYAVVTDKPGCTEVETGISSVHITVTPPSGAPVALDAAPPTDPIDAAQPGDGTWAAALALPTDAPIGDWGVDALLTDAAGNVRHLPGVANVAAPAAASPSPSASASPIASASASPGASVAASAQTSPSASAGVAPASGDASPSDEPSDVEATADASDPEPEQRVYKGVEPTGPTGGALPYTGANTDAFIVLALALFAAGGTATVIGRRRA